MRGGIQPRVRPDREHTLDAPFTGVRISWLMVARKSPLPGGRPRFGGSFFAEGQEQFVVLNDEAPQAGEFIGRSHSGEACERRSEGGPEVHPVVPRLGCEGAAAAGIQVGGNEDPRKPRARLRAFEIKPMGEAQINPARATPTRKANFSQRRVLAAVGLGQRRGRNRGA